MPSFEFNRDKRTDQYGRPMKPHKRTARTSRNGTQRADLFAGNRHTSDTCNRQCDGRYDDSCVSSSTSSNDGIVGSIELKPMRMPYTPVPRPSFDVSIEPMSVCNGRTDYVNAETSLASFRHMYDDAKPGTAHWRRAVDVIGDMPKCLDDGVGLAVSFKNAFASFMGDNPFDADLSGVIEHGQKRRMTQDEIDAAIAKHAQWLYHVGFRGERLSLTNVDLSGVTLSGRDLRMCQLTDCNLQNTDLSGANLTDAMLSGCDMSRSFAGRSSLSGSMNGTVLNGAALNRCVLDYTDMTRCSLDGACLRMCSLVACEMRRVSARDAIVDRCRLDNAFTDRSHWRGTLMRGCSLEGFIDERASAVSGSCLASSDDKGGVARRIRNVISGRRDGSAVVQTVISVRDMGRPVDGGATDGATGGGAGFSGDASTGASSTNWTYADTAYGDGAGLYGSSSADASNGVSDDGCVDFDDVEFDDMDEINFDDADDVSDDGVGGAASQMFDVDFDDLD